MEKSPLNIRTKKPTPVQVNRFWIISILALMGVLFLLVLITVFSPKKQMPAFAQTTSQNNEAIISPLLSHLPSNYQDTKTIAEYLQPKQAISAEVQNELGQLRAKQTLLQSQLMGLQRLKMQSPLLAQNDIHRQEAETSGLFFPGGAPEKQPASNNNLKNMSSTSGASSDNSLTQSSYTQQNMQQQKMEFLKPSDQPEDIYNPHQLQTPVSPYEIQAGTIIPSVLITGVQSSLPGEVISQTRNDVYDTVTGQYLLIPKGSKLLGEY
jgi:type IV secretion system protein VirB10